MDLVGVALIGILVSTYSVLTGVGLYCIRHSNKLVKTVISRDLSDTPSWSGFAVAMLIMLTLVWIIGLLSVLGPGGVHGQIARGAEGLHESVSLTGEEKKLIRIAVRKYRVLHRLKL
jgi:hypothetical protein